MGDVHETNVMGYTLAWKRMIFRRNATPSDRKEVEIMKKISHKHMVELIGTYTHQQHLGMLLYPVATCDLHTFFEDVEAFWTKSADSIQTARLRQLKYFESPHHTHAKAHPIYSQLGCLISAVEYLHWQKIRHKDLKPSNILLMPGRLYISDFGSATDFSLLSKSATDNDRGTPRYFAPEVREPLLHTFLLKKTDHRVCRSPNGFPVAALLTCFLLVAFYSKL